MVGRTFTCDSTNQHETRPATLSPEMSSTEAAEPSPEEQKKLDQEAKAKEDAEQAALPYKWTQTISDVDLSFFVPGTLKGRDLDVQITKTGLKAAIKGQAATIDVSTPAFHPKQKQIFAQEIRPS